MVPPRQWRHEDNRIRPGGGRAGDRRTDRLHRDRRHRRRLSHRQPITPPAASNGTPADGQTTTPTDLPTDPAGPTGPTAGATAPSSALPENAGGFVRDHSAEQREAASLLQLQNNPPPQGHKYQLGPLFTGIYNVGGAPTIADELLVVRAEGQFSDPGAALTDLTQKARRSGTEITPVGSAFDDGRALCLRRQASAGDTATVTACYSVNSSTLLLVLGGKSIQEVSNAWSGWNPR